MTDPTPDRLVAALRSTLTPERPHYALGTLLGADDFLAEQHYHRGRLARALAYLFGPGTVAGLRAGFKPATLPNTTTRDADNDELYVEPGLALDAYGRLIEVPRRVCIRLRKWFDAQDKAVIKAAAELHATAVADDPSAVQTPHTPAWLFLRFRPHASGVTPVLADGPFDATNAIAPARTRDGHELRLFLVGAADEPAFPRAGTSAADLLRPAPQLTKPLPAAGPDRVTDLKDYILDRWEPPSADPEPKDIGWLLLGRVDIPTLVIADIPNYGVSNGTTDAPVIDNHLRPFVYGAWALALHAELPLLARTPTL